MMFPLKLLNEVPLPYALGKCNRKYFSIPFTLEWKTLGGRGAKKTYWTNLHYTEKYNFDSYMHS